MTICDPCRSAGDIVPTLRDEDDQDLRVLFAGLAVDQHAECIGSGWCDCQHRVPGVNYR